MKIEIVYMLTEDRDPYYIIKTADGHIFEVDKHWRALDLVRGYVNANVYDETYDATFEVIAGEIEHLSLPIYMEEYRVRYVQTFYGMYKEEPLQPDLEEELVDNK